MNNQVQLTFDNISFSIPQNTQDVLGTNELSMFNPASLLKTYEALDKHYPVSIADLPKFQDIVTVEIQSDTLNESYLVCAKDELTDFFKSLADSIDAITRFDFFSRYPINRFDFSIS